MGIRGLVRSTPRELGRDVAVLDGIRGLAILQVVLGHTHYVVNSNPYDLNLTRWTAVNRIFIPADLGLDIFFALSGFLITSLLLRDFESRAERTESAGSTLKRFYARRALRLLPALYVMLALDWLFEMWEGLDLHSQWRTTYSALFYIANWASVWNVTTTNGDLGHLWSLAVEEQFYIVWPIILVGLMAFRRRPWPQMGLLIGAILLIAQHRTSATVDGLFWLHAYIRTDMRVDSMIVGAVAALIYRYLPVNRLGASVVGTISLAAIIWYKWVEPPTDLYRFGYTRNAVLVGLCILAAVSAKWWFNRFLGLRPLVLLGKYSYGLYLYHHIIFLAVGRHMIEQRQLSRLLVAYGLSAAFTWASWKLVEKPCLRLKHRFESRSPN